MEQAGPLAMSLQQQPANGHSFLQGRWLEQVTSTTSCMAGVSSLAWLVLLAPAHTPLGCCILGLALPLGLHFPPSKVMTGPALELGPGEVWPGHSTYPYVCSFPRPCPRRLSHMNVGRYYWHCAAPITYCSRPSSLSVTFFWFFSGLINHHDTREEWPCSDLSVCVVAAGRC